LADHNTVTADATGRKMARVVGLVVRVLNL